MNEANNLQLPTNPPLVIPDVSNCPFSIVFNEDCVQGLKRFSDNYFDLAIVDPPYGIGIAKWDIKPTEEYWNELWRVSKNQIVWGANYFHLPHSEAWMCWHKTAGFQRRALNGQSDFELAWTSFDRKARLIPYTYSGNIKGLTKNRTDYNYKPIHPTQKPIELYELLLEEYAVEGDLILDTHLGSGSSRIAANKGGFNFIGFEIDKEYYEKQEKRFKNFTAQQRLF
jgi:site-specific DNA-methyltransferase (adenine-specific)